MAYFINRLSKEDQVFHETKTAAAEFYRVNRVPEEIERALSELFFHKPADIYGYLVNYFTNLSTPPRISRLNGREVYDTRGQLSIEAEVFCIVCNKEKLLSSATISSHFGHKGTLLDWKADGMERAGHVMTAIQWVNEPLNEMLKDQNPCDQSTLDHILSSFFMAHYLEVKGSKKEENCSPTEPVDVLPPSPPEQTKGRRSASKGKKNSTVEKPLYSPEPTQAVLPGSLAIGSVSLALVKSGAQIQGIPLYKYIGALKNPMVKSKFHIPTSLTTLLTCGRTSPGKLNLLEEVILIPKAGQRVKQIITTTLELEKEMLKIMNTSTKAGVIQAILSDSGVLAVGFERPEQPLDMITEACHNLELELGTQIHLALNCAAPELWDYSKGKYEIAAGLLKSPEELVNMYQSLLSKYPAVVALIDPLRREDTDQWQKLSNVIGDSCLLVSDITYIPKTSPLPGVRGHVLKHSNETTISDLIRIISEQQGALFMGTACNESSSDDSLSDVAVGLGLDYIKLGGLCGAERMTKYNRLIAIEEELVQQGIFVSKEKHPPPMFPEKPLEPSSMQTDMA
ncbi:enolase 4 [Aulostomus maculatus]